ncbi:alpha/beta hydrolase [Streptomyces sp. NPDC006367]|uniref:alpha/beta fold hydrolase n=1 Tax=unclassified Streptomyces TaxID=2593676 RepID=UPI0033B0F015
MAAACIYAPLPAHRIRELVRPRPYPQPPIDHAARWFKALMQHDVTDQLEALGRIPVRILVGENDQTIPPIHALRLAAQIATARLHVIPGGGHRLPPSVPRPSSPLWNGPVPAPSRPAADGTAASPAATARRCRS